MLSDRCLSVCLSVCPVCLSVLSVCPVCKFGVLWPNGWMHQDETWHAVRPSSPPQKGGRAPPIFAPCLVGQQAGWIQMALGMEVSLGSGHIVLDEDPAPPPQKGTQPPIFGPSLFGQTAGWIKVPLGTKVGLGSGHIVTWGFSSSPPKKRGQSPQFSSHVYCQGLLRRGWRQTAYTLRRGGESSTLHGELMV